MRKLTQRRHPPVRLDRTVTHTTKHQNTAACRLFPTSTQVLTALILALVWSSFLASSIFPNRMPLQINDSPSLSTQTSEEEFLPQECHRFLVKDFPTLTSLLEQGKGASMGKEGGHWSACTHVKIYGMNFAAFFARHLAYGLQPRSVLEFGCGLGTTSDFLARFVPGGCSAVCVEPEAMLGEVFGSGNDGPRNRFPNRPLQLAMLSFSPEAQSCSDALYNPGMGFELVLSLEVAEHIPNEYHSELVRRLVDATTKYLVFAASRPGQRGTGHIDDSMHNRTWWIEQFEAMGKLRYLPQLSRGLRYVTAHPDRGYDLGYNLIALGVSGVVKDTEEIPQIAHDCSFYPSFEMRYRKGEIQNPDTEELALMETRNDIPERMVLERPCEFPDEKQREIRHQWVRGQEMALWPELDLLIRRVQSGNLQC